MFDFCQVSLSALGRGIKKSMSAFSALCQGFNSEI